MRATTRRGLSRSVPPSPVVRLLGVAAAALLLLSSPPARADVTWNVVSGDWSSAGNWSGSIVPTGTDNADIFNGGTVTITTTGDVCSSLCLDSSTGSGSIQMTDGALAVGNSAVLGYSGTGNFAQSGGTNAISYALYVGEHSGGSGTYSLNGSGLLSAPVENVGWGGTGNFTQSGGTNSISGALYLGYQWYQTSSGTYGLSGSGQLSAASEAVGYSGTGSFTQSGGTNAIGNCLSVGFNSGASGSYSLSGGYLSAGTYGEWVGCIGAGNFTQSGGTNRAGTLLFGTTATFSLNGGVLTASAVSGGGGAALFNFGGGTLQASGPLSTTQPMTLTGSGGNATVDTAGYTVTFSGSLSGPGGLTKTDAGALVLAASNIYSGGTEVDNGTLVAANGANGSATGSGNVTLNGGTLASATSGGSISGGVQIGSVASEIAPGGVGSIGPLTIGSLTTASCLTTLNFDLTTPGGSGDLLIITSPNGLTLAPHTAITFGTDPTTNGEYPLIGGSFGTPDLSYFDLPAAPPGLTYSLTVDQGYIDLVVVPEPSTLVLLGIAAIGLLGYARRRKRTG